MSLVTEEALLALIDEIYASALEPDRAAAVCDALSRALGGAFVTWADPIPLAGELAMPFGATTWDEETLALWGAGALPADPLGGKGGAAGTLWPCEEQLPWSEARHTAWVNEFLLPRDVSYRASFAGFLEDDDGTGQIPLFGAYVKRRDRELDSAHLSLFHALIPHARRAVQIHRSTAEAGQERSLLAAVIDRLSAAVFILNEGGRVVHANQAAQALCRARDGILVDHGALRAARSNETRQLRKALASALRRNDGQVHANGGVLRLSRPSGRIALEVLAAPIPSGAPGRYGVAVFVTDPESRDLAPHEMLAKLYALTPAEARTARLLMDGLSVKDAAETLGIRESSTRIYVKRLLEKTQTRRQAELVRRLVRGVASMAKPSHGDRRPR